MFKNGGAYAHVNVKPPPRALPKSKAKKNGRGKKKGLNGGSNNYNNNNSRENEGTITLPLFNLFMSSNHFNNWRGRKPPDPDPDGYFTVDLMEAEFD
jgi:hypothetical protein